MPGINDISDALTSAGVECENIHSVEGFSHPMFLGDVSGKSAMSALALARRAIGRLGLSPVLVGESQNGENETVGFFADDADEAIHAKRFDFNAGLFLPSAAATLAAAEQLPFEAWLEQERDLKIQYERKLAEAQFYELGGHADYAKTLYAWAERILEYPPWTFDPGEPPPPNERMEPQHEPLSIRSWDPESEQRRVPPRVAMLFCPTVEAWQIPAYAFFTTRESQMPPQLHTAFLRWLHEGYGATLVALDSRIIEVVPATRPTEWIAACRLAADIRTYSPCCMKSPSEMDPVERWACHLMDSTVWSFCWP